MRTATQAIALFYALFGGLALVLATALMRHAVSWSTCLTHVAFGLVLMAGAYGLLTRRKYGWWLIGFLSVAGLLLYVRSGALKYLEWRRDPDAFLLFDNGFQMIGPVLFAFFCAAVAVLIMDRPSKWS